MEELGEERPNEVFEGLAQALADIGKYVGGIRLSRNLFGELVCFLQDRKTRMKPFLV